MAVRIDEIIFKYDKMIPLLISFYLLLRKEQGILKLRLPSKPKILLFVDQSVFGSECASLPFINLIPISRKPISILMFMNKLIPPRLNALLLTTISLLSWFGLQPIIRAEEPVTKIGIHVVLGSRADTDDVITMTKNYGVSYTRSQAINLSEWPYTPNEYNKNISAGLKVLLNINWASAASKGVPVAFPKDMTKYSSKLTAVLNGITKPELVVIENEEINPSFHSGPIQDYVIMLKTASPIVHAHGLKLTNGGVYGQGLDVLVYRYLKAKYGQSFAETNYGNLVFQPFGLKAANTPGSNLNTEDNVAQVQAILNTAPYLDFINIHHYEIDNPNIVDQTKVTTVTPGVLKYTKEFIETTTGKPIMCNETSIRGNKQPALVTALLQDFVDNKYPYVIWWDNTDGNQYNDSPLNDGAAPFAYRPNGLAFQQFMFSHFPPVTVNFVNPTDGANFSSGANITVEATATDSTGASISKVDFYDGNTLIKSDTIAPYTFTWSTSILGDHVMKAVATNSKGQVSSPDLTTIHVVNPNRAPVAQTQSITTAEDIAKLITLSATDADGDSLTYSVISMPLHGNLTGNGPNRTYSPNLNYNGPDNFIFQVDDGKGGSSTAKITITVTPVNDTPVANSQSISTEEDTSVSITLSATDIDGDTLTYSHSNPLHGTMSGSGTNITYTPAANYNGTDSFTFKASDGTTSSSSATVTIAVTSVNDAPTAVITSPANGYILKVGSSVQITVDAADGDGSIASVEFLCESNSGTSRSMGIVTQAPFVWTKHAAYSGDRIITVKVTDNEGAVTVSAPITLTQQD
jgi:hypothetical protein